MLNVDCSEIQQLPSVNISSTWEVKMTMNKGKWEFWIDKGGTFTDVIAKKPDGTFVSYKLLSENPLYKDATKYAITHFLGCNYKKSSKLIKSIKLGTTLGTNALLEKKGEPTVLVTNKGFADMLRIGYQNRPDLFALNIILPDIIYSSVIEIKGRYLADGTEEEPIDIIQIRKSLLSIFQKGIRSVAIVLMHGYKYPLHEMSVATIAKDIGFKQISASHEVSPRIKIVTRGNISVLDAYLTPLLQTYINTLKKLCLIKSLFFMQSYGGLTSARNFRGKNSILSGPAAGIVAAAAVCSKLGFKKIISFDMGGTSTDVARYDGQFERVFESEIAGFKIQTPMLDIRSIAAGGGSIIDCSQGRFQVGPKSAGATPGPACYGQKGPLTLTDCHVLLGRIQPEYFPQVFGKMGKQTIDKEVVIKLFKKFMHKYKSDLENITTIEQAAEGFLNIAILNMASSIKKISIERGYDTSDYTLCSFGGAGAQHACKVCEEVGIHRILIHKYASVFCAYGLGLAEFKIIKEKGVHLNLNSYSKEKISGLFLSLEKIANRQLLKENVSAIKINTQHFLRIKYEGSDLPLVVEVKPKIDIKKEFEKRYNCTYGFTMQDKNIIIDSIFVELTAFETTLNISKITFPKNNLRPKISKYVLMYQKGNWQETPLFIRNTMQPGMTLFGPAIIIEPYSTIIVEKGWKARVSNQDDLLLERYNISVKKKKN